VIGAWALFPLALVAITTGCGLALEWAAGRRIPGALLLVAGLAVVVVVAQLATATAATAKLATPAVVALAVAGAVSRRQVRKRTWRSRAGWSLRPDPWPALAAVAVFVAYGAPVLMSGEATFAGYVKLDDTATWLAITDRVLEHGRSAAGLPPSSYEATLDINFGNGYPIGAFLPLGVGSAVTGQDPAWVFQPYMALLGALLALGLYTLAGRLVSSPPLRAAVAFVAAQPALLVGYSLWGGVKEVAAAALLPLVAWLAIEVAGRPAIRAVAALGVAGAAVVAVLSVGGLAWLAPLLAPAAVGITRQVRERESRRQVRERTCRSPIARGSRSPAAWAAAAVAFVAVLLVVPALALGGAVAPWARSLTSDETLGNLLGPLSPLQLAGVWPSGDFRLDAELPALTWMLIAVVIGAAVAGVAVAALARAWSLLAYVAGALAACAAIAAVGSPWVDGKALAIASPAVLLAACIGAVSRLRKPRPGGDRQVRLRTWRLILFAAIAGGVLWSNALAYREVTLAPRSQLAELERIEDRIAGEGPTLMTEYQPYGVRHFLRDADPEGASELRRRRIPLRGGTILRAGRYADLDELDPSAVLAYRTLVLRRSPAASRPPSPYRPVFRGDYYDVWQRHEPGTGAVRAHLGLGTGVEPTAVPSCGAVRRLGRRAGQRGVLAAVARPPALVVPLSGADHPPDWSTAGYGRNRVLPRGGGEVGARVRVERPGTYGAWVGGSVRSRLRLLADGEHVGSARHQINNSGQYIRLGDVALGRGVHELALRLGGPDLHPGSGGQPLALGPLTLTRTQAPDTRVEHVRPAEATDRLCGRPWDWVEVLP
jgi:hypothetical protein